MARPQDGRIKTVSPDGEEIELRISTMLTAFGERSSCGSLRPMLVRDFQNWDSPARTASAGSYDQRALRHRPGHRSDRIGQKDTTLYSTMKLLATPEVNVYRSRIRSR